MAATPAATPEDLFAKLAALGIETVTHEHPPLFTVEESKALRGDLPGGHCKSLFLRDKKRNLWLAVMLEDRAIDMKEMRKLLGASGSLSFGAPELLDELLGVKPGAVTPFALMNDTEQQLTVVLDAEMMGLEPLNYHPLKNTATTAISPKDLLRFIEACGHRPEVIDLTPATRA